MPRSEGHTAHGERTGPDDEPAHHAAMDHAMPNHAGVKHGAVEPMMMDHVAMGHDTPVGGEMDHAVMSRGGNDDSGVDHSGIDRATMSHNMGGPAGMERSGHMMGGFMSMVAMTKDLPRSEDGLPMEWVEAPFGPLFPGLPGGLGLILTLDGDGVARAALVPGAVSRDLPRSWPGPATTFPDRLARLDPTVPITYRVLAQRALAAAAGLPAHNGNAKAHAGAVERERAANHLGWLAALAALLGDEHIAHRAAALQLAVTRATGVVEVERLRPEAFRLTRDIERAPLWDRRLAEIGCPNGGAADAVGPVARAAGRPIDARTSDPDYHGLSFVPVVIDGGDALARLRVRLAEIVQALDLVVAAGTLAPASPALPPHLSDQGMATVETPRGPASLHVVIEHGAVTMAHLNTPSSRNAALVPTIAEGLELADALVAVASLDLSPWELDR
jgi:Ni,Fe-hydrogenase III large subunit